MSAGSRPETWIKATSAGLFVEPGGFFIDPGRAVDRAVVSHGHGDHARPGHGRILATADTLAIMAARFGERVGHATQALAYGERLTIGAVSLWLAPAGHILGSAQIVLEHAGTRVVVSGDYKRRPDPTCAPFEPITCDVFVTEATFGLPIFQHPPDRDEIDKLLKALALFPERCAIIGVYALGKCQRVIALLRRAGYDRPIYLDGSLERLCALYRQRGVALGALRAIGDASPGDLAGAIVMAQPGVGPGASWFRYLPEPIMARASGWLSLRRRVRQSGIEIPLIISDHADWAELFATFRDVGAGTIWVTHGQEDAIVHEARRRGFDAQALALVGYGEDA
ncbi:MAG: ligase-associated DNA damage response exonuclease [Alphaproteobacteria bacterium]|nr:ligase-associated DNA damage response exonuclease [Alphaproteobacteria bacterium]